VAGNPLTGGMFAAFNNFLDKGADLPYIPNKKYMGDAFDVFAVTGGYILNIME
jgi:hypothetical protein